MTWVYQRSEASLWTIGFYDPKGEWYPTDDFDSQDEAAARVAWLNGGSPAPVTPSDLAPAAEVLHRRLRRAAEIVGADYTKRPIQELLEQAADAIRDVGHVLERRFGHSDSPDDPDALIALRWLHGQHPALQPTTAPVAIDPALTIVVSGRADDTLDQYGRRDGIRSNDGDDPDTCQQCNGTIDDHVEDIGEGPHGEEIHSYRCLIDDLSDVIGDMETAEPGVEDGWLATLRLVETAYRAKLANG